MNIKIITVSLLVVLALGCQQITTQALLDTNISDFDKSPPVPLIPIKGATTDSLIVPLSWTARNGFTKYTVEISSSSDFSKPIPGSPFTASGTSLTVTLPDAVTYWWRVKTSLMQGTASIATFEAMNDAVYVYCAENTTCDDTGKVGNKSYPLQSVRTAVSTAKALGKSVKVASRGATGQAYFESVSLADGVSLAGGYNSTFNESQVSPTTNVTAISSSAMPVSASLISTATVFEGFKVIGLLGFGLYLDNCSANLTIRNSVIASGDVSSGNTSGITINAGNPNVMGNTVSGGNATATSGAGATYAILNQSGTTALISGNTLSSGVAFGTGSNTVVRNVASSPTIINNILVGSTNVGTGDAYGITAVSGSNPKIINNTIIAGTPTGANDSAAIVISTTPVTVISAPVIVNNILSTAGGTNRYCVQESLGTAGYSNPAVFQNNLLFNCPTALYYDVDGANANTTILAANNASLTSAGNAVSGNVTIAGAQNPFLSLASKNYHLQNNGAPMTVQEWLNIAYGGLNTSGSTFGSVTTDRDSVTRTATAGGAANTGAAGYSIGAYEF